MNYLHMRQEARDLYIRISHAQHVPEKLRLEIVVDIEIEILDGRHRSLLKRLI